MGRQSDERDGLLIALLRDNARTPVTLLARRLGLSRSAVQERLARLERQGVIAGYTVRLGQEIRPAGLRAYVMLSVDPKSSVETVAGLRAMPEVEACSAVAGTFDLVVLVVAPTAEAIDRLLDRIGGLPGVERTVSLMVLATKFDRR